MKSDLRGLLGELGGLRHLAEVWAKRRGNLSPYRSPSQRLFRRTQDPQECEHARKFWRKARHDGDVLPDGANHYGERWRINGYAMLGESKYGR